MVNKVLYMGSTLDIDLNKIKIFEKESLTMKKLKIEVVSLHMICTN
jgi:hypothetical protein